MELLGRGGRHPLGRQQRLPAGAAGEGRHAEHRRHLLPGLPRQRRRGALKVKNSGHASPGHGIPAYDFLLNPTNNEVDGTQVAWDFLSRYRLK